MWFRHRHAPHTNRTTFEAAAEFSICRQGGKIWAVLCKRQCCWNTCSVRLHCTVRSLQFITPPDMCLLKLFVSFIGHSHINRKTRNGERMSHIHTINVWVQVAIYNSVSLLLDAAVTVRGKLCHIIVKLRVTLTSATAKASVDTLGQDECQITFAPHSVALTITMALPDTKSLSFPPDQ